MREESAGSMIVNLVLALFLISSIVLCVYMFHTAYKDYKEYDKFCDMNPMMCYCNLISCEFMTQRTSTFQNGELISEDMSNQTKELCKIAGRLEDKELMFKMDCICEISEMLDDYETFYENDC